MATMHVPNVGGSGSASPSQHPEMDRDQRSASPVRPHSRRNGPRQIPNFVFPALPTPSTEAEPDSPPSRSPSPSHDDALFPVKDTSNGPAALPSFSFNPGASLPPDPNAPTLLSPPTSPHSPKPSPNRPVRHGHRRGGSEFVGGSIRDGNSIAVMSTSPTKEGGFTPQSLQPPPRRGHRRGMSGAISTNDLPILPPPVVDWTPKGNSAPNSPTNFDEGVNATIPLPDDPPALSTLPEPIHDDVPQPDNVDDSPTSESPPDTQKSDKPAKAASRARVGFSDTLEFIPRPLSLVSSDTSSTVTARPPHSVSGSISSLVSPASPADRDFSPAPAARAATREFDESRPSTAGAILERAAGPANGPSNTSPRRRNSIPLLIGVPEASTVTPATPSPTKSKRWSFFGLEPFSSSGPTSKLRPISSSSSDSHARPYTGSSSDHGSDSEAAEQKKKRRKSRKNTVKGWAGSILPLKTKSDKRSSKPAQVRPPTPPPSITPLEDEVEDEAMEDADIPTQPTAMPTPPQSAPSEKRPEDSMHPMIDLDAALGPFNTPLPHNPEWEAAQKAAGNVNKRRLHSAQGMKGFVGPGMHYHRRAESAPDLPPFDPGRNSIHRFGSNSTMADVFEEDEEEDEEEAKDSKPQAQAVAPQSSISTDTRATDAGAASDTASDTTSISGKNIRRTSSGLSDKDQTSARSVRAECSKTSLHETVIMEEPAQGSVPVRSPALTHRSRDSLDSGAPSPKKIMPMTHDLPTDAVPVMMPQGSTMPLSPYSMSNASSHPSPRSPVSIDAQRMSTAPSSVADDNCFQSLLMGEPGPEVRISVDYDIPSLTSSTSTMTRESAFTPTARPYQPNIREQARPSSVSSAAFGRRRSSLISLSRLISSSHGERSKLSTELTLDGDAQARAAKKSKTKKFGRMMQFWKPAKEESST